MADNVDITPGTGLKVATDDVSGVHYQRVKLAVGDDGSASDATEANPLPTSDAGGQNLLRRILQMLMSPLGYDKSLGRQRGTVVVESGTVTTVSTVTTVTTVTTLTGLTNIGGYPGQMLLNHQNLSAWAQCVRARIT